MIIPEEALAISPKVRLLYDAEVDEDLTVHDATLHVWRVTGEAACELDYGTALTPQDLQDSRFFILGKDPGPFNLWLRPDGHSYSRYVASDFATINVVKLSMEVNGPGEEDDFILAGTEGTVTVSLDGWIRPEGHDEPLAYRQYTLTNEEGGADLLFWSDDANDWVNTLEITLNSDKKVRGKGSGAGQAEVASENKTNADLKAQAAVSVPQIQIEINNTPTTADDIITAHSETTGRIRLVGGTGEGFRKICITNVQDGDEGDVRFKGPTEGDYVTLDAPLSNPKTKGTILNPSEFHFQVVVTSCHSTYCYVPLPLKS
ncbi:MAG: hypothetical protein AB1696_05285 [Planctomycetota bacterium]